MIGLTVVLTIALAWHSAAAAAAADATDAADAGTDADTPSTRVLAGTGVSRYDAVEPLPDGRVFNREQGSLRRSSVELRHTWGDWSLRAALRQSEGTLDYGGQTQFGLPLITQTDLARREIGLSAEYTWVPDEGPSFGLGAGVEALRTVREIRSTPISSALTETLRTHQWVLTTRASMTAAVADLPMRISGTLQLNRPWSQSLAVDTHGVIDPLELRPANRWGGRLGLDVALAIGPSLDLGLDLGLERYRPGAAEAQTAYRGGVPAGSASYPGSVQKVRHFAASLAWRF